MSKSLSFNEIIEKVEKSKFFNSMIPVIKTGNRRIAIKQISGAMKPALVSALHSKLNRTIFMILGTKEEIDSYSSDLTLAKNLNVISFKDAEISEIKQSLNDNSDDLQVLDSLSKISGGADIILAQSEILEKLLPPVMRIEGGKTKIKVGEVIDYEAFRKEMIFNGFEKCEYVGKQGQIATRGGIIDIFPAGRMNPIRIECWGDEIESIREFDLLSQRSISKFDEIEFYSDILAKASEEENANILDYLPENALIIIDSPESILANNENWTEPTKGQRLIINPIGDVDFEVKSTQQPSVNASIKELVKQIRAFAMMDYDIYLSAEGSIHTNRLRDLIENTITMEDDFIPLNPPSKGDIDDFIPLNPPSKGDIDDFIPLNPPSKGEMEEDTYLNSPSNGEIEEVIPLNPPSKGEMNELLADAQFAYDKIKWLNHTPNAGFVSDDLKTVLFTEHQIFNRLKIKAISKQDAKRTGISLRELKQLQPGDYVVHTDKGIGRFVGIETVSMGGSTQDCVKLLYDGGDSLYVHLNYIHKIQKYSAVEGSVPKLSKLGSAEWERKKSKTKKRLKDIARDLIKIYAKRKASPGYSYPADTIWQKEFEASFMFEDTPDQSRTTSEVKKNMEETSPMDRLVCGDVGFGKTEIAIRAAFKAAQAGKQTAVLVPTTILAQQHYESFRDRMSGYPVNIGVISRFRTKKEQTEILEKLEKGACDILIGTHRLLSKDIKFKDLGLLIIDEEHRFGVAAKEKLRDLRSNIDTLTLTATPIPRTLNFSLMGARDLSLIETPPRNRLPVNTKIVEWNDKQMAQAIRLELERKGQIYIVHDRVKDIDKLADKVRQLAPMASVGVAHGQLPAPQLEKEMQRFIERKYDILIATKIVESGLDIPNANTIIINRAQNFGLAELYQLRGRVGRSNIQAYCYLCVPSFKIITNNILRRLQAIEEFTDLGSGFKLAMRDMEIRGAGNLLGGEQSGFIIDIGYELFHKILDEAVQELRYEEFGDIFDDKYKKKPIGLDNDEIAIELNSEALIPAEYIQSEPERFQYYKQFYNLKTNEEVKKLAEELEDRFGKLPKQVHELLFVVRLRIAALGTGFQKIVIKRNKFLAEFPPESAKEFYEIAFPDISDYIMEFDDAKVFQENSRLFLQKHYENRNDIIEMMWRIKKTVESVLE